VDLLTSLTNPFADYRANMRTYHLCVWVLGLGSAAALLLGPWGGELTPGVCWVQAPAPGTSWLASASLWALYGG
jgi:hypothetical protein